jgi:hypothetical protein
VIKVEILLFKEGKSRLLLRKTSLIILKTQMEKLKLTSMGNLRKGTRLIPIQASVSVMQMVFLSLNVLTRENL